MIMILFSSLKSEGGERTQTRTDTFTAGAFAPCTHTHRQLSSCFLRRRQLPFSCLPPGFFFAFSQRRPSSPHSEVSLIYLRQLRQVSLPSSPFLPGGQEEEEVGGGLPPRGYISMTCTPHHTLPACTFQHEQQIPIFLLSCTCICHAHVHATPCMLLYMPYAHMLKRAALPLVHGDGHAPPFSTFS